MNGLEQFSYRDGPVVLTGWLGRPKVEPHAAVVIYPTIANITPRVAEKAQQLCHAGYLVLVADYYGGAIGGFEEAQRQAAALCADNAVYRQRLKAALSALDDIDEADGLSRGAIGFCMGGQAALEMARSGARLDAIATFHGLLETPRPAMPGDVIHPRILVCHGDKDPLVPRAQVTAFMEEMDAAGVDWHLHIYSRARHGFTDPANDLRGLDAVAYDASADRHSWCAMLTLFDEVFGAA